MTGVTLTSSAITLYKPDGTSWTSTSVTSSGGSGSLDQPTALPPTGTYTVRVNPTGAATGVVTLTLSSEVTGTVTINDPAMPVTLARPGQNGRVTFSGTSGQQVTVRVTGNTVGNVTINVYRPDGSYLTAGGSAAASFNLTTTTLPTTGPYTITINPTTTTTGSLNLQVTSP